MIGRLIRPHGRHVLAVAAMVAGLMLGGVSSVYAEDGRTILLDVDRFRAPADDFAFDLEVDDGKTRLDLEVRVAEQEKSLVIYRRPAASAGRILLMVGRNVWIYMPGTQRPIRMSPEQQLLGGVSNADVARVVFSLDYDVVNQTPDSVDGQPAIKLALKAQPGAPYDTMALWVTTADHRPLKAEAYGTSGRLLKTTLFTQWQFVAGRERPMTLLVEDKIKGAVSQMKYSNLRIEKTPTVQFQPSYLNMVK